jgi:hypothetical protein
MSSTSPRSRLFAIAFLALFGALLVPVTAVAATERFHRFEVVATANYVVTQDCGDGRTTQLRVSVLAGHEEESTNGETTFDEDFLTVLIRGFDCEGNLVNDRGFGTGEFTYSPSLQTASTTGTVVTRDGRTVEVDMSWDGVGPIESSTNTTTFEGFTGVFQSKRRDAVATGTVVVDGETIVDGSTSRAQIETFEDNNTSRF